MKSIKRDHLIRNILVFIIILGTSANIKSQSLSNKNTDAQTLWGEISPFFSPQPEFKDQYGDYRSPLKFYDGHLVKTPKDWKERRTEILDRWSELMGKWPPLIKNQDMEVLETTHRDGFTQLHIRFYWMPNEKTEGYLLIPEGEGKKPAVITYYRQIRSFHYNRGHYKI